MKKIFIALLLSCIASLSAQEVNSSKIDTTCSYYKVYHAAQKALKKDKTGIKELMSYCYKSKDIELTKALVKAMCLGMKKVKSKSLTGFAQKMQKKYSTQNIFAFLQQPPLRISCETCLGSGQSPIPCADCLDGNCRNCKGSGRLRYETLGNKIEDKPCPICRGVKHCTKCKGSQEVLARCTDCRGRKHKYVSSVVPDEYTKALKYLVTLTPKLAEAKGLYIGVGVNKVELARLAKVEADRKAELRQQVTAAAVI